VCVFVCIYVAHFSCLWP